MAYEQSIQDRLTSQLSPVIRKLSDLHVKKLGAKISVLRIIRTSIRDGLFGEENETLESSILANVILNYPLNNVELFARKESQNLNITSISLMDILPVKMRILFEGDYAEDPIEVQEGDYIIDCFFDDSGDKIPLILQVTDLVGSFFGKYLVKKEYHLSLERGAPEDLIQAEIDTYLATL